MKREEDCSPLSVSVLRANCFEWRTGLLQQEVLFRVSDFDVLLDASHTCFAP